LAYAFFMLLRKKALKPWWSYTMLFIVFVAMILSNFRMLWIGIVFTLAVVFILHVTTGGKIRDSWGTLAGSIIILALALALVFVLPLRIEQNPAVRFGLKVVGFDSPQKQTILIKKLRANYPKKKLPQEITSISPSIRWYSWAKAVEVFSNSPILGTGVGYKHKFTELGSNLKPRIVQRTVHNDYLQIFMHTGSIGGILFLLVHAVFFFSLSVLRRLKHVGSRMFAVVPLFTAYLIICYEAFLMPTIVNRPSAVVFYSLMAIIMLLTEDYSVTHEGVSADRILGE
ncbi:MAG: O-antigen ligase family protein, partial [Deltaproteobacteria bacterium]|nr:O-antigen ligase family protein [Deltaproteobacteria bacterium]